MLRVKHCGHGESSASPNGLVPVTDIVKLAPPTDKVISTEGDIRRSDPMEGNASHRLKWLTPRRCRYGGSLGGMKGGELVRIRRTVHRGDTAGALAPHADSRQPGLGERLLLSYCIVGNIYIWPDSRDHAACVSLLGFVSLSIRHFSLATPGGRRVIDRGQGGADNCAARPLFQVPPRPATLLITTSMADWQQQASVAPVPVELCPASAAHNNIQLALLLSSSPRLLHLARTHLHPNFPKPPLRGIGLCNGLDTVVPYKCTSSTYSRQLQFWLYSAVMRPPSAAPAIGPP